MVLIFLGGVATPVSATSVAPPRIYRPPLDAPVVDPFRLPTSPWLPGNRGLEYAPTSGLSVHAIGPGVVIFAGPVAGSLHVTIRHPDGLRSSYSFVAAIRIRTGDVVAGGDVVAVAADRFHLGVRRGDTYLDPASLWGQPVAGGRASLIPTVGRAARSVLGWLP